MNKVEYAKQYPFGRPGYSYLFIDGEIKPINHFDPQNWNQCALEEPGLQGPALSSFLNKISKNKIRPLGEYIPVISAGSNASPDRLVQKYQSQKQQVVIPVIRGTINDFVSVYSAHFTRYGSIAATMQHSSGAQSEVYVSYLDPDHLKIMHSTESLGSHYAFAKIKEIEVKLGDDLTLNEAYLYVTLGGCLFFENSFVALSEVENKNSEFINLTQSEILAKAFEVLGGADSLDNFILKVINSINFRSQCTQQIRNYSKPFNYSEVEYI
jgi:hypothetical protein